MITESVVVDVSQDWVVACGLQERFMEIPYAKTQRLTYNARCRQMRALGGDCFHFVPGLFALLAISGKSWSISGRLFTADKVLMRLVSTGEAEAIVGDLLESRLIVTRTHGPADARLWYWTQLFLTLRPLLLRELKKVSGLDRLSRITGR
jgi:hypothetical protein